VSSELEKQATYCEAECQFYYSPSFVCNMGNRCPLLKRLEVAQKEIQKNTSHFIKQIADYDLIEKKQEQIIEILEGVLAQTRHHLTQMPIFILKKDRLPWNNKEDNLVYLLNKVQDWQEWFDKLTEILDMKLGVLDKKEAEKK